MNKNLILSGVAVLLITVGLSGCNEESNGVSRDTNEVEVVSHNIEFVESSLGYDKYIINGTIKNIGDKNLDEIIVRVNFYDKDNELLLTKNIYVYHLANGETNDFEVIYYKNDPYFEQYDHYKVEVNAV